MMSVRGVVSREFLAAGMILLTGRPKVILSGLEARQRWNGRGRWPSAAAARVGLVAVESKEQAATQRWYVGVTDHPPTSSLAETRGS